MAGKGRLTDGLSIAVQRGPAVFRDVLVREMRRFPLSGKAHVEVGQTVEAETPLGLHNADDRVYVLRVSVFDGKLQTVMIRKSGDNVKAGETIGFSTYAMGLGLTEYCSPVDGHIISIDTETGTVLIQEHPQELRALLPGVVKEVIEDTSVTIEAVATVVEGVYGDGFTAGGNLVCIDSSASHAAHAFSGKGDLAGKVAVVSGPLGHEHLMAALRNRMVGVIAGSGNIGDVRDFVGLISGLSKEEYEARFGGGRDLRTVIEDDGYEPLLGIVLTEGFGRLDMRKEMHDTLKRHEGEYALLSIPDGYTESRGVPRIIVPNGVKHKDEATALAKTAGFLCEGSRVRLIGYSSFGTYATVVAESVEPFVTPSGIRVPALVVRTDQGQSLLVPERNVETV